MAITSVKAIDVLRRVGGTALKKTQLKAVFDAQKMPGRMTSSLEQLDLRRTFLEKVASNHPAGVPALPFDLSLLDAQKIVLNGDSINSYNLSRYLNQFKKLAPQATAGLRETFDVLDYNNPNYMYNPIFLAFLIEGEARFIKELHADKVQNKLSGIDLADKAKEIEQALPAGSIKVIREIFGGRSVEDILILLRDKPLKVMGKEVRPQTDEMLDLESRIMAANDITVVTSEHSTDTTNIYLTSLICFLLGSDGGTYYTPSHSSVYVLGRKALAGDGAQLLPDVYSRYIEILESIHNEAKENSDTIPIAGPNDPNILRTLSYDRSALLFKEALAPTPETIATINLAAEKGFRLTLNTLSGSASKSLMAQLKALGIRTDVFEPLLPEEDPFFRVGYVVAYDKVKDEYFVDHLGVDTSSSKVVRQIPYAEYAKDLPIGRLIYECDPDNDRFMVKQVLTEASIPLCETFGIQYYKIGDGKIIVAPSPNKTFLLLDIADYERTKASGEWDRFKWMYFPTYVSTAAWVEFAKYLETTEGNIATFLCRVGFKNFNQALAKIQDWWFNRPNEETLSIQPQLGDPIVLDRSLMLRVLSKEEESGGRTSGFANALINILGDKALSMPEKAVGDALYAHLADMAKRYLDGQEMRLPNVVASGYDKYHIVSRIDDRFDILHGDQGRIAQVGPDEAARLKSHAGAEKSNFNNFFFSIASAVRSGKLSLERAKEILTFILPEWKSTWHCLDQVIYVEETLDAGNTRSEGVLMAFSSKGDIEPLVTFLKFRPSGTDPLKSKVYLDAKTLSPENRTAIEKAFETIKRKDLYSVLDRFGVVYAEEKPAEVAEIGLQLI
ncbi:hypothetical protein HZC34_05525 [Candidatus Saganbacteria bacterium]|nr:hypothetical protein [Candidatus Saganbacteria bacterium]